MTDQPPEEWPCIDCGEPSGPIGDKGPFHMTDHREQAKHWLAIAIDSVTEGAEGFAQAEALIALTHALLAQDHNRCTATRGHANGHHYPADTGVTT